MVILLSNPLVCLVLIRRDSHHRNQHTNLPQNRQRCHLVNPRVDLPGNRSHIQPLYLLLSQVACLHQYHLAFLLAYQVVSLLGNHLYNLHLYRAASPHQLQPFNLVLIQARILRAIRRLSLQVYHQISLVDNQAHNRAVNRLQYLHLRLQHLFRLLNRLVCPQGSPPVIRRVDRLDNLRHVQACNQL